MPHIYNNVAYTITKKKLGQKVCLWDKASQKSNNVLHVNQVQPHFPTWPIVFWHWTNLN